MGLFMTLNTMLGRGNWPPPGLAKVWEEIELFSALRASDTDRLKQQRSIAWQHEYMVSPLPRMISRASAHLLFGEPADIRPENDADSVNLARIVDDNDLSAELHRGAVIASSEGEVWGRIVVDPSLLDVPIIEFVSRNRVIPHFAGRFCVGATFVTEWATGSIERYRLMETYEAGAVTSRLFRGTTTTLGGEQDLNSFDPTKGRQEQVLTGIDWPLATFIPNTIDADPTRGYSDYVGLQDRFLALNDAGTIGQKNMRLAGRKRAMVDEKYLHNGRLPEGDDVYIRQDRNVGDDAKTAPIQIIDYQFQADQTVMWIDHLIDTTLTFAGVSPQAVGRSVDGGAISGTAMKLKMNHSLLEAAGKGRYFDRGVRRLLRGAQVIDGRPTSENGFGRTYASRDSAPVIERHNGLPQDDVEAALMLNNLVAAEAISLEQRVRFLHPDWSETQVSDEVKAINSETGIPPVQVPQVPNTRRPA
jgi:hypothetical protein